MGGLLSAMPNGRVCGVGGRGRYTPWRESLSNSLADRRTSTATWPRLSCGDELLDASARSCRHLHNLSVYAAVVDAAGAAYPPRGATGRRPQRPALAAAGEGR